VFLYAGLALGTMNAICRVKRMQGIAGVEHRINIREVMNYDDRDSAVINKSSWEMGEVFAGNVTNNKKGERL
jgi:hypothetical protein